MKSGAISVREYSRRSLTFSILFNSHDRSFIFTNSSWEHTISLAVAYLQTLHESDITGLYYDNGSYNLLQNEMHEKLDILIGGTIDYSSKHLY